MKPGDLAVFKDPAGRVMYGDGGYTVLSIGRVNVKVSCDVRFSPTGPWHHQEHRFPIAHVARVIDMSRNGCGHDGPACTPLHCHFD